ncbi:hypothetical protein BDQ17DRAFT_1321260 [Cyathus striatus]|nr:hypothetical protein BDQ17DRAFT_1321260 [Cyathus striatus]
MSSHSPTPPFHLPSSTADIESDVEDEVDQLDSDSDLDDQDDDSAATSTNVRAGQRTPGQPLLPSARMENIIQADGVTGDLALSKEGFFLLSVATEEFIKRMVLAAHEKSATERRPTSVTYPDMAWAVKRYRELNFLVDTIPQPISLHDALLLREERERGSPEPGPSTEKSLLAEKGTPQPSATPSNGIEKVNGISVSHAGPSISGATVNGTRSLRVEELAPRADTRSHRSVPSNGDTPATSVSRASPAANGLSSSLPRSETRTPYDDHLDIPPPSHRNYQASLALPYHHEESPWPGHFTGPASGFLQGPAAPFGRPAQSTGRTIYSQSDRPG